MLEKHLAEKRDYGRLEKVYKVVYSLKNPFDKVVERGSTTTSDISLGGLKLFAKEKIAGGSLLDLEIKLKTREFVFMKSKVVWSQQVRHGFFYGLAFLDSNDIKAGMILESFFDAIEK